MSSQPPSKPANPTVIDLAQPEKLSNVLKDDRYDCLACRLTGRRLTHNTLFAMSHFSAWQVLQLSLDWEDISSIPGKVNYRSEARPLPGKVRLLEV